VAHVRSRAAAIALGCLFGLLLALGGVLLYVRREIADEHAFAARLTGALNDAGVRAVLARRTVDALTERGSGDVLTIRPLAIAAVDTVAGSPAFRPVAAQAAADTHRALRAGHAGVSVRIDQLAAPLLDALRRVSPGLAAVAQVRARPVVVTVPLGDRDLRATRWALDLAGAAWWVLAGALACAAGALLLAPDRRRAAAWLGAAAAVAGGLVAAALTVAGARLSGPAGSVWDALFGDLRTAALAVSAGGLVAAVLAGRVPRSGGAERRPRRTLLLAGAGIAGLAALVAAALIAAGAPPAPTAAAGAREGGCNGAPALCERRLEDVVFAGTHNSYAAADEPGWLFANQRFGIARQLDDGIRALLIDIHTGVRDPDSGLIRTDLRAEGVQPNKVAAALGPAGLRAARRAGARLGGAPPRGERGLYLCHTLCELGAEPLGRELGAIRGFLEAHPGTVLMLVVEPYVSSQQVARAFEAAGLLRYVATLDRHAPLPTLGMLVASDRRLVVFAEEGGGNPAWYMPAFSFIQDTPLAGAQPGRVSCALYRGAPDDPILLINNWDTAFPPRPSANRPINTLAALQARVRGCEAAGRPPPGIVAVDFYERSAVVELARELNDAR